MYKIHCEGSYHCYPDYNYQSCNLAMYGESRVVLRRIIEPEYHYYYRNINFDQFSNIKSLEIASWPPKLDKYFESNVIASNIKFNRLKKIKIYLKDKRKDLTFASYIKAAENEDLKQDFMI